MKLGEHIRLKALLAEALEHTKHVNDPKHWATFTRSADGWLAVRIMCEALLGEEKKP